MKNAQYSNLCPFDNLQLIKCLLPVTKISEYAKKLLLLHKTDIPAKIPDYVHG